MNFKTKMIEQRSKLLAVPALLVGSAAMAAGIGATTATLMSKIFCKANTDAAGFALVAIGLGFVVYKGVSSFFGDGEWTDNIKVIVGGLILAVIGTQLGNILVAIGFAKAATACA